MKQWLLLVLFLFLTTNISYAAGMIMRVQQMKQMKAQQQQEEYLAAYQQYQQNQQQNAQAQGQQQAVAVQKTYQQTIDDRNQAIAQAIAQNQASALQAQQQGFQSVASPQVTSVTSPSVNAPQTNSSDVKDVVDLSEVWKRLDTKSMVWTLLIDDQAKVLTVSEYINRFSAQGVKITAPPEHYVQALDQLAQQNPQMLQQPFGDVLKILAIVDYDFDNGMDKDMLAKQVLGEAGFEQNKKRIADAQAQAQQAQQAQSGGPPGQ